MAVMTPSGFFQNRTDHQAVTHRLHTAAVLRRGGSARFAGDEGFAFRPNNLKVLAQAVPNMSVRLSAGIAVMDGAEAATQGNYVLVNDAEITPIAIGAAHATLQRFDVIYSTIRDAFYSGANNDLQCGLVQVGTNAAVGTAVPNTGALPSSAIIHGYVQVDPGVTSIPQSKILDARIFYAAQGGVRVIRSFQAADAGVDYGDLRYRNGHIQGWNAEATTGWRPLGVDNFLNATPGSFSYGLKTVSSTVNTIVIPDPGYPYFIEGECTGHCVNNAAATRWDLVARLDTSGGTLLSTIGGISVAASGVSNQVRTPWWRSAVQTGGHSVVVRYEKIFGGDSTFNSEGTTFLRIVPQPPAANDGNLINV